MNIDEWIHTQSSETLENILVDILVTDGSTYSGFINSIAYVDDPEHITLTSRSPREGLFVGKKILKKDIIGFNFSVIPRANFGVHQIRIAEKGTDLHFQHAVHDDHRFSLTSGIEARDKFVSECLSYIRKLVKDLLPNEKIGLILHKDRTLKLSIDSSDLGDKIREFLY